MGLTVELAIALKPLLVPRSVVGIRLAIPVIGTIRHPILTGEVSAASVRVVTLGDTGPLPSVVGGSGRSLIGTHVTDATAASHAHRLVIIRVRSSAAVLRPRAPGIVAIRCRGASLGTISRVIIVERPLVHVVVFIHLRLVYLPHGSVTQPHGCMYCK